MTRTEKKYNKSTKKLIIALFELLEKKNFIDISVKEICDTADINRSTFYAHFNNTYELLEVAQQDTYSNFFSRYNEDESIIQGLKKEDAIFVTNKYLIPYLQFVKDNKKIFKVYIDNLDLFKCDEIFEMLSKKVFFPIFKKFNIYDDKKIKYALLFYLKGIFAIIIEWLNNNCNDDIEYISKIIIDCIRPSVSEN